MATDNLLTPGVTQLNNVKINTAGLLSFKVLNLWHKTPKISPHSNTTDLASVLSHRTIVPSNCEQSQTALAQHNHHSARTSEHESQHSKLNIAW